jgi:hypothetical protein
VASARGRLIAVEAVHGTDLTDAADTLYERLTAAQVASGISRWDASGLFSDVVSAPVHARDVSPRTLLLLYAADLAFRIRWEIGPALEQGLVVVAAPYIATAAAFGRGTGLGGKWLSSLFRFAPAPAETIVLRGRKRNRPWKRKPDRGFGECCTMLLSDTPEGFARRKAHAAMVKVLGELANDHGGLRRRRDISDAADRIAAGVTRGRRPPKR